VQPDPSAPRIGRKGGGGQHPRLLLGPPPALLIARCSRARASGTMPKEADGSWRLTGYFSRAGTCQSREDEEDARGDLARPKLRVASSSSLVQDRRDSCVRHGKATARWKGDGVTCESSGTRNVSAKTAGSCGGGPDVFTTRIRLYKTVPVPSHTARARPPPPPPPPPRPSLLFLAPRTLDSGV
jgi:hypothetical protein